MPIDPADDLPDSFQLPPLPPAFDAWFELVADRDDETEVIADGAILYDLGVVDEESARLALIGYHWVFEDRAWRDSAESGEWDPRWIVLDSVNADPIIADLSHPDVPVLEARPARARGSPTGSPTRSRRSSTSSSNDDVPARRRSTSRSPSGRCGRSISARRR